MHWRIPDIRLRGGEFPRIGPLYCRIRVDKSQDGQGVLLHRETIYGIYGVQNQHMAAARSFAPALPESELVVSGFWDLRTRMSSNRWIPHTFLSIIFWQTIPQLSKIVSSFELTNPIICLNASFSCSKISFIGVCFIVGSRRL